MTKREAIKQLKLRLKKIDMEMFIGLEKQGNEFIPKQSTPLLEAINIAIEALGKQIEKKPYCDKSDERTLLKCPSCKYIFVTKFADGSLCGGRMMNYCPECGQKLDWGNEE